MYVQTNKELARAQQDAAAAQQASTDAAWELRDLSVTSRAKLKTLFAQNQTLDRRVHDLSQQLLAAVPARAYYLLLDKYKAALAHRRSATVDSNNALLESQDAKGSLERQLFELEQRYVAACARAADAETAKATAQQALQSQDPDTAAILESDLAGQLRQKAVEVETAQQRCAESDRKANRLQEDAEHAEGQLRRVREQLGHQAKRAVPPSHLVCLLSWLHVA
jgi:hypothetical protein